MNTVVNKKTVSVRVQGKSHLFAYLLWVLAMIGLVGVHRFYLGRIKTGVVQLLLAILGFITLGIGLGIILLIILGIWLLMDLYFIHQFVEQENAKQGVTHSSISVTTVKTQEQQ